jgi:hypothetical protein
MSDLVEFILFDDVREAFEILVDYVASQCAPVVAQTVENAGADIMAILRGEWDEDAAVEQGDPDSRVIAFAAQAEVN